MGAVPRLYQPDKVGAFTLHKDEEDKKYSSSVRIFVPILKADVCHFLKEQDVNARSHLFSLSCHLTFSLSLSRGRPMDLFVSKHQENTGLYRIIAFTDIMPHTKQQTGFKLVQLYTL